MLDIEVKILKKALVMFSQTGPNNTTMDDIASTVGISKKTLYKHFDNKTALVEILYRRLLDHAETKFRKILDRADNAVIEFTAIFKQVISFYQYFTPTVLRHLEQGDTDIYTEINTFRSQFLPVIFSYNIERGIDSGFYKKQVDSNIIAHLTLAQLYNYKNCIGLLGHQYSEKQVQEQMLAQLIYGITSPKGSNAADLYFSSQSIIVRF